MFSSLFCPDGTWQPQSGPLQVSILIQMFQIANQFYTQKYMFLYKTL